MRIIAGSCRGRPLKAPTWEGLRPSSDRLRETLFNILAPRVIGARVLDLFAGTGAVGIEALSRGAAQAVFVDHDRRAVTLIEENAARCGVADRCAIIRAAAEEVVQYTGDARFEIAFLDPPYAFLGLGTILRTARLRVEPAGVLVLEHAWRREPPSLDGQGPGRTVRLGDSALSFYDVPSPASSDQ
jgi:16S rRNA (guanine(966)-N(2))-methyltransferase RsmD